MPQKKGKKGENTSNEGESDGTDSDTSESSNSGGSEKEDVVEMSTEDKEEESKEGKKKDDGNDILIDYSDKETKYWKKSFEVLEKKVSEEVFRCSSCNEQVNHQIRGLVKAHPVLGVFLCKRCRKFYGRGRFCKDDEGYDEYCRWCAEGGDLLCCEQEGCFNGFCKRCIKRNLGRSEASHAENAENWSCYVCDKGPLREPRAILRTIIYCIDKAEQKADKMSRTDHKKKDMKSKFELLKRNRLKKIKENVEKNKKCKEKSKDKVKKEPKTEEDSKADLLAALSEGANRGEPWLQDSIDSMGDMIQICQLNLQKIDQKWKRESCSSEATGKAVGRILKQIKAMSTNFNIIEEHLSKSNTDQGDGLAEASTSNMDVENADDKVTDEKEPEQSKKETKDKKNKSEGNEKKTNEDEEEVSMKSPRKGRKTVIESDDEEEEEDDDDKDEEETESKKSPKKGRKKSDETDSSDDEIVNDNKSKSKEKKTQSIKGKSDKTENKSKNKGGDSSGKSSKDEDESKDSAEDNEIVGKKGDKSGKSSADEAQDESKDSAKEDETGKDDENVEKKRKRNSSNDDTDDKTKEEDIKNKRRKSMRGKSIDEKLSEEEDEKLSGRKTPNKNQKVQDNKKGKASARKGSNEQTGSDEDLFADSVTDMDATGDLAESSINGSLSNDEEQKVKVKKETEDKMKKETKDKIKKEDLDEKDVKSEEESSENEKKKKKNIKKVKSEDEESSENEKKKKKNTKKENEKSLNSLLNSDSDSDENFGKSPENKSKKKSELSKKNSKSPKKSDGKSPKKKTKDSKGNEKKNNESDHESEEESVDSDAEMLGFEARASDDDRDEIRKKKSKKRKDDAYTPKAPSKLRGPRSKRKDKKTLAEEDKNDDARRAILDSDSDVTDADSEGDGESIIKNRRRKSKWTQDKQLAAKCFATIKNLSKNMTSKLNDDGYIDLFEFPELTKLKRRKGWLSPRKKSSQLPLNSDDNDSDEEFARLMKFKVPKPAPKSRKKKPEPRTDDEEEDKKENLDKRKHNRGGSKKKKKEGLCDIDINNDDDDDDQEEEEEDKKNRKSKKKTNDNTLSLNEKMKKNILMSSDEDDDDDDEEEPLTDEEGKNLGEVLEEERRKKYEERRAKKKEEEEKRRKEREEAGEDTSEEDNKTRKKKKGYMNLNISSSEEEDNDKDDEDDDDDASDDDSDDDDDDSDFSDSPRKRRAFDVSDSDSDFKSKKRKGKKSSSSDDDDDEESSDDDKKKSKRKRIKRMTSSEEGDEDEEEEGSPKKDGESPSKKKKIRKILADDDLEKSTVDATADEDARRQRIRDRQKQFNHIFEIDLEATEHDLKEVVLDYDKDKEPVVSIHEKLVKTLKPHQIKGIKFMWDATLESVDQLKKGEKGGGCILAHCMGLGKTLQIITYVHTLLVNKKINRHISRVMVCCPVNTVYNWVAEFKNWLKGGRMCPFDVVECVSAKDLWGRAYRLDDWWKEGGVMIMGYDMFRNLSNDKNKKYKGKMKEIFQKALVNPGPDVMVCDEGHILKNEKTNLSKAINTIETRRRIILTGTPLQNNLSEYHCMVQFVKPSLLGTLKEFRNRFVNPIEAGQSADSLPRDVRRMKRRAHILHNMLEGCVQRFDYTVLKPFLPPKFEYVLSVQIAPTQEKLYRHYLDNLAQGGPRKGGSGLFVDFGNLSRIWTHPKVLELAVNRAMLKDDLDDEMEDFICDETSDSEDSEEDKKKKKKAPVNKKKSKGDDDEDAIEEIDESAIAANEKPGAIPGMTESGKVRVDWWKKVLEDSVGKDYNEEEYMNQMEHSGKLILLLDILRECNTIGDKILVFSQSLLALDMIEEFLRMLDQGELDFPEYEGCMPVTFKYWKKERDYMRLDGSCSPDYRRNICKDFNRATNERCRLFLISTRAGGLGINLVAANRVIIFDSSWNPSHDTQSIFRVYRFGQKKPCYVYRFVAQGTMEEKIYSRQVTKESTSMRVVDENQIKSHFNMADLQELYSFTPEAMDKRDIPDLPQDRLLAEMLKRQNKWIVKYHEHDSLLEHQEGEGLSEEERKAAWEDYENEKKGMFANQQGMGMGGMGQMANMNNMGGYGMPSMSQFSLEGVVNTIRAQNPALSQQEMYRSVELATKQIQKIHLGHYQRVQAMVYNLKNPMLGDEQRRQMPFGNHPEMMPFLEQQLRTLEENIQRENQVIQQMAQLSRTAATPQTMMAAGLVRGQPGTSGQVSGTANYVNHSKTTPAAAAAAAASKPSVTIKPTPAGNKPAVTIKPIPDKKKISSEVIDLE